MSVLNVYLRGVLVAHIDTLSKVLQYVEGATDTPLSRALPLETRRFQGASVEQFIQSLLPDSPEVLETIARKFRRRNTPFDLIELMGLDCAGAIQICTPEHAADVESGAGKLVPLTIGDIEARLAELEQFSDASWIYPGEHWSLGGAQQKFALRRHNGGWFSAEGNEPTTHILKPGIRALAAQALNEHLTMCVAAKLGIRVAATHFESFKSQDALVVERFDRAIGQDGKVTRLHYEELRQAMGTRDKYQEYGGPSVQQIAEFLWAESESRAQALWNVEEFARGLVFNTLIAAPDAHAGNYSLALSGDSIQFAPLYDVASGLPYLARERKLSMAIGGEFDPFAVGDEQWAALAKQLRLPRQTVRDLVRDWQSQLAGIYAETYEEFRAMWGKDPVFDELAQRFATALGGE